MMQTEREYARALYTLAEEENAVGEYCAALGTVKTLLNESPDYIDFLACPAIPLGERTESVDEAFGTMPEYVVSFIKVLCENGRVRTVNACIDEFVMLAMAYSNRTVADIYSAVPLTDEQKQSVIQKLEKITGKNIDPVYTIDESLIGGIKIDVDGKTYDGSIRHRLGKMKDVMNS